MDFRRAQRLLVRPAWPRPLLRAQRRPEPMHAAPRHQLRRGRRGPRRRLSRGRGVLGRASGSRLTNPSRSSAVTASAMVSRCSVKRGLMSPCWNRHGASFAMTAPRGPRAPPH